jgi:hypothetical protein
MRGDLAIARHPRGQRYEGRVRGAQWIWFDFRSLANLTNYGDARGGLPLTDMRQIVGDKRVCWRCSAGVSFSYGAEALGRPASS